MKHRERQRHRFSAGTPRAFPSVPNKTLKTGLDASKIHDGGPIKRRISAALTVLKHLSQRSGGAKNTLRCPMLARRNKARRDNTKCVMERMEEEAGREKIGGFREVGSSL